jgi:hypothetical protein
MAILVRARRNQCQGLSRRPIFFKPDLPGAGLPIDFFVRTRNIFRALAARLRRHSRQVRAAIASAGHTSSPAYCRIRDLHCLTVSAGMTRHIIERRVNRFRRRRQLGSVGLFHLQ